MPFHGDDQCTHTLARLRCHDVGTDVGIVPKVDGSLEACQAAEECASPAGVECAQRAVHLADCLLSGSQIIRGLVSVEEKWRVKIIIIMIIMTLKYILIHITQNKKNKYKKDK